MAEYCKDCFKKLNPQVDVHRMVMSREMELCEGCGQLRPCVVRLRKYTWWASGWFSKMRQMEIAGRSCNVELMQEVSGMSKSVSYDLLKRYKEYKHIYG